MHILDQINNMEVNNVVAMGYITIRKFKNKEDNLFLSFEIKDTICGTIEKRIDGNDYISKMMLIQIIDYIKERYIKRAGFHFDATKEILELIEV